MSFDKIHEVVEVESFDKLPTAYAPYLGIMNLRGVPIQILDMFSVLDETSKDNLDKLESRNMRIVVCETLGKLVGIVACHSIKMYEFEDRSITPTTFAAGKVKNEYVVGIIEHEQGYIFMLNIETVLDELDSSSFQSIKANGQDYLGKRALVVEDSKLYRKKLTIFLEKIGFDVILANDGVSGLERLKSDSSFDIIFTDIEMPLMNGIEMIRKVKGMSDASKIPVLFHSSISNEQLMNQIVEEELGVYITKFDEEVITAKLKEQL